MGINNSTYSCCLSLNKTLEYVNVTNDNISISYGNHTYVNCDTFIGKSFHKSIPISCLVIAIIGLLLNLILIKDFIIKTTNSSRKQSSMKKLFTILPVLECLTSIYWILSSTLFKKTEEICTKSLYRFILSVVYFTVYTFEFIFINFILVHFRKISLNPIEGILKPERNIKKYILFSVVTTLLITGAAVWLKVLGRSPMNTCFINTEDSGLFGLIFLIPIIITFIVIIQVIYDLKCREMFLNDKQVREAYKLNSMYILVFSLFHIPMFILIAVSFTFIKDLIPYKYSEIINIYSTVTTILTCSIPMIIGMIRNCKGFTKIKKVKEMQRRITLAFNRNTITKDNKKFNVSLNDSLTQEDQFDWLEKHAMEFFMRDILLGVAYCLNKGKDYGTNIYLEDLDKENENVNKYNICFENFKLNDATVNASEYLNVNIIEYAPKIFAFLRNLEKIDIDQMINSFLPKNNKQGISESQGKSGSFFISTDDNQFMIKTLRVDEFDLIRKTFLNEYVKYLTRNESSLLCRIYGMYNIIMSQGDEMLIIVMRNVIGEFKNNIIAKFDLKGSSKNRISEFDMAKSDSSTMKDLNFNQMEYGIMLSKKNIKKFRKLTYLDSRFLRQMELMDYSLFLVKLTLDPEEAKDLFGDKIKENQDKAFNDLIVGSSIHPDSNLMNNEQSLKMNYENLNPDEFKLSPSFKEKGKIFKYSKYYKQYLFPSLNQGTAYILAIIDYFQMFNFYKYVESGLKTSFGFRKEKVSCVDPKTYSKRFINYFIKLTDIKHMLTEGQKVQYKKDSINEVDDEDDDDEEKEDINLNDTSDGEIKGNEN